MLLENKVAVVFGGSGEVGRAIALGFAREGAVVYLAGRTLTKLQAAAEQIRQAVLNRAQDAILAASAPHYRKVINATGIILHTALGRAVLPANAIRQITQELTGYSLLQADVDSGARSKRDERIEWLLHQLTGAEAEIGRAACRERV